MQAEQQSIEVVVLGAAGYGGGELLRLLMGHPAVSCFQAVSQSQCGQAVSAVHPHLRGASFGQFVAEPDWAKLPGEHPLVVFSAQPHGILAQRFRDLQPELGLLARNRRLVLIDLSADFRLFEPHTYEAHSAAAHPCPELLGQFVYALPEMNRARIAGASWLANPGCFATAMCLSLLPLSRVNGLGHIALTGVTGSSGSGTQASAQTHHPSRAHDYRAYQPLRHRHLAEAELVMQAGGATGYSLSFVPHSAPLVRGIHLTTQLVLPEDIDPQDLPQMVEQCYVGSPFVHLLSDRQARVAAVAGSNHAELSISQRGRQLAICCALDNLGKGMAGQAVQNMNIALGLSEDCGLTQPAIYP